MRICGINESFEAANIYDTVILAYEAVLQKGKSNNLLWRYQYKIPHDNFDQRNLSEAILWLILSEAHCGKGEYGQAVRAYKKVIECSVSPNPWLQTRLVEACKFVGGDTREPKSCE